MTQFGDQKVHSMSKTPPTLETERLRLRGHRYEDLADCVAMWGDPLVTRYIGGKPSTESQTWARLQAYVGHWVMLGFGYWVIESRDDGQFVGEVGVADFKRDIAPEMRGYPEIGFALASAFHGRGIAIEASRAVLAWTDAHLSSTRTVCLINPENIASRKVAEACGYRMFANGTFNEQPVLFLERFSNRNLGQSS